MMSSSDVPNDHEGIAALPDAATYAHSLGRDAVAYSLAAPWE